MKRFALILVFIALMSTIWAEAVEESVATRLALSFFNNITKAPASVKSTKGYPAHEMPQPDLYIVSFEPMGYVLVAADDRSQPILAYSTETPFPYEELPEHVDWYLGEYSRCMAEIREHPEWEIDPNWERLANQDFSGYEYSRNVSPLCATRWNQNWPYNALCPEDSNGPGGRVYAGCVATTMAQIMKKWNHPITGTGSHSYYATGYGVQTANFGEAVYEWHNMPNYIYTQNIHIATIIYHCGVSVNMNYSPNGSGAYSSDARNALVNYFKFHSSAATRSASSYTTSEWANLLISNLDSSRPMMYQGYSNSGGHSFLCDGYQGTNYFHFNWGWGGTYDGYYYLNNLNPGSHTFTNNQGAVVNIFPISMPQNDMAATSISGSDMPVAGVQNSYQITVNNTGQNPQSNYTVRLYRDDNILLASVPGTSLLSGQSDTFELNWTPDAEGAHTLYGKVSLNGDMNPDNDMTDGLEVQVLPAGTSIHQIGFDSYHNTYIGLHTPYGTLSKAYRQQYLVLGDELSAEGINPGSFIGLGFEVALLNNCLPMPNYRIRLMHTQLDALDEDFEAGNYQTVCEYDEFMPEEGWNYHEFQMPFAWDGESNIIVDITTDLYPDDDLQCASVTYTLSTFNSSLRFDSMNINGMNASSGRVGRNRANMRFHYQQPGNQPHFLVSPTHIDFGEVLLGETSAPGYINLSNIGSGSINLAASDFEITGAQAALFSYDPALFPVSLRCGESLAIPIFATAEELGDISATLTVSYGSEQYNIELTCLGGSPAISEFPFFEGFEEGNIDNSSDIYKWNQISSTAHPEIHWRTNADTNETLAPRSGAWNAVLEVGGNSTLFRPIMLEEGQGYSLKMWARQDTDAGVQLQALLSENEEFDGELVQVMRPLWVLDGDYQEFYGEFLAPDTGIYYLGIHAEVDHPSEHICLDDITIDHTEITDEYEAPTNLQATVNGTNVCLSWEAPNLAKERSYMFIGYEIFMNDELITFINNPQATTFKHHSVPNGEHIYGVSAVYSSGDSEPTTIAATVNLQLADAIFEDSFETYPNFAKTFDPWTVIDVDRLRTSAIDGAHFTGSGTLIAFMVFNPQVTIPPLTDLTAHEGDKMAASFAIMGGMSDDFLITPRIQLTTNSVVKFHALSYMPLYEDSSFRIGVSTANDPEQIDQYEYILGEDYLICPSDWTEFCFDISQYDNQEVLIAIESSFDHASAFMVDSFSVHSGAVSTDDETAPALLTKIIGNYPNPFNPETTISYVLSDAGSVKLDVYNLKGQLVRHLVDAKLPAGEHRIVWDGRDNNMRALGSGVYFLKLNSGKQSSTKKMIMMK